MTKSTEWVDLEEAHRITRRSADTLRRDVRAGRLESRRVSEAPNAKIEISVSSLVRAGVVSAESEMPDRSIARAESTAVGEEPVLRARLELMERHAAAQAQTINALLRLLDSALETRQDLRVATSVGSLR